MTAPIHPSQDHVSRWTAQTVGMNGDILDRMERAVAKVRERLLRASATLNQAGVPYAVVGGHAVASWVATVDEGAVRNTPDIDLLIRRADCPESRPLSSRRDSCMTESTTWRPSRTECMPSPASRFIFFLPA